MINGNSGPIPGANYTSDTKNYPWRQPPEFTDIDDALDFLSRKLTKFEVANGVLTMAGIGVPLYKVSSTLLMLGVGEGKWTVDHMLLLAGPVTRMIELICIGFDVEYDLGIYDDEDKFETGRSMEIEEKLKSPEGFKLLKEEIPDIKDATASTEGSGDSAGIAAAPQEESLQTSGFMAMNQPVDTKKDK